MNEKTEPTNAELLARIDQLAADNVALRKEVAEVKILAERMLRNQQDFGKARSHFGEFALDYDGG